MQKADRAYAFLLGLLLSQALRTGFFLIAFTLIPTLGQTCNMIYLVPFGRFIEKLGLKPRPLGRLYK
jgi:hypothetical protein